MRLACASLLAALLAGSAAAYRDPAMPSPLAVPRNGSRIANMNFGTMFQSWNTVANGVLGSVAKGTFEVNRPGAATEKVEVTDIGCLDTMVPPPLNWGPLWCAGRDAKVMQWTDEVGAMHRTVDIPVQPNVTANMVLWLFSPLFPQYLEFAGKQFFWYHLWHPIDHIMAANKIMPSTGNIGMPGLYTLIHERYRNLPTETDKNVFETEAWFHVEDLISNFLKKRIVISMNMMGTQGWTLLVNLKDTPQGLKIDPELILGAAARGYDKSDPSKGASPEWARLVNDNIMKPMIADNAWASGAEFDRSLNAITRHVVEEFSMFRFFLPQVWTRFPHLQGMFALSDAFTAMIPRLNYGPFMKLRPHSAAGLTEMMMPLNRTALNSFAAVHNVAHAVPSALASGAAAALNAHVAAEVDDVNSVVGAAGSGDVKLTKDTLIKIAVPSYTG